jgi:rare lipoprotein A
MGRDQRVEGGEAARAYAPRAFGRLAIIGLAAVALSACASSDKFARRVDPAYGVPSSPRVVEQGDPVPKVPGVYRLGKPYVVAGRTYTPEHDPGYRTEGMASWYGIDFHGRLTANGEIFDQHAISAAHPTLPMPSYARVTNLANRRSIIVRVNDRGPYAHGRVIDVSSRAAELLGFKPFGVARVRVEYVGPASLEGSDDRKLAATLRHGEPAPAPSAVMLASTQPFVPLVTPTIPRATPSMMPTPPERPYEIGHRSTFVAATPAVRTVAVTRVTASPQPAPAVTPVRAPLPEPTTTGPVIFSARGLY